LLDNVSEHRDIRNVTASRLMVEKPAFVGKLAADCVWEIMMDMLDAVMVAGICLAVGACAFFLRTQAAIPKHKSGQDFNPERTHRGWRLDLYMCVIWSGFLLVQTTNVFHHVQRDGTINLSLLSLAALAANVFICGAFAARLLLGREMRLETEKHREVNGAALT
jgi:hypothetical protein